MPRQARQQSENGIFHLIIRGINRQVIFEDEEDRRKFRGRGDGYVLQRLSEDKV